ncbi:glycoside hydrolase family 99-like domain-containing protein [Paraburkholderia phenoliruptrix]|uniref:glycoside hydrolase family 99-like domain-containing protein n=1 Tax=Paraburkholderia phenoliruptrix TaxID=252970 RepID=UPI003D9727F4
MSDVVDAKLATQEKLFEFLRWNSYRSERHKLLYIATPKVACTSLKWWFAALEGYAQALYDIKDSSESDPELVVHESHKVAPHVTGLVRDDLYEALTSDKYFRFAVVRNPYKRIFSAWQSKLVLQEPLQAGRYTRFEFFHLPLASREDIAPAFESFLEHLASNEAPSFWDHHWTPQASLLKPEFIQYSQIAKIEDNAGLSDALKGWLGGYLPNPFDAHRANESLIPYQPDFITERSGELLRAMYAEDFDVFGYDRKLPQAKETFSREQADVALKAVQLLRARHAQLGERSERLTMLTHAVHERDNRIAVLGNAASERDDFRLDRDAQIAAREQAVAEREQIIANLNRAVAQREQIIANLNRAVAERDAEVSRLNRQAIERNTQVAALTRAVAEREAQVKSLEETAAAREARVAECEAHMWHLERGLAERDAQIAVLRQEAAENGAQLQSERQRLAEIFASRTWYLATRIRKGASAYRRLLGSSSQGGANSASPIARARRALQTQLALRVIRGNKMFDGSFYLANNPDVRHAGIDPVRHYLLHGWRERRDPSPAFSTARYLSDNPDVEQALMNPLVHYLRFGQREGRVLRASTVETAADAVGRSATDTQLRAADLSGHAPIGQQVADHIDSGQADPQVAVDNRLDAEVEAIRQSGLFDESYYLSVNAELNIGLDEAIRHYCERGWREGRNPSDDFNTRYYLSTYSDIREAGINPFWHYVIAGKSEARHAAPAVSNRHEDDVWFGCIESDVKLIAFYKSPDWAVARAGRPMFKGHLQPFLPSSQPGFYDPLDKDVMRWQAAAARRHGVYAFCFDVCADAAGPEVSQPVAGFLATEDADIRFCVQLRVGSPEQSRAIADRLARCFADRRYVRVDDRPVVLISIADSTENAREFIATLRRQLAEQGMNAPEFIASVSTDSGTSRTEVSQLFDASLDLSIASEVGRFMPVSTSGINVVPYSVVAANGVSRLAHEASHGHISYPVVTLSRDNSAARGENSIVYTRFDPKAYRRWLDAAIANARAFQDEDRRIVFVNAWNDWNAGMALEPDHRTGFNRLNETARALTGRASGKKMPKVSVIVPNFRHEQFLRRRLDSVYGQTYKNIEVLLLDDCSPDGSRTVMDEYASAYPEITRTFYNDRNSGGVFRQWAKGIQAATGELVWIAESDDFCDDSFLETLVSSFEDESVMLAYSFSLFVDRDEKPIDGGFHWYVSDLDNAERWKSSYVETAHNEVRTALGIKNTIPNASSVVFRRPVNMPLLEDESWLSMRVAGDWVFYLHLARGGKIAFCADATNFFRRYPGSTADTTYKREVFYREVGMASRTVAQLYDVPLEVLERCRKGYEAFYLQVVGGDTEDFLRWYDYFSVLQARQQRLPNVMVTTMGFSPGGAEILPIRIANELKRQGHSVVLLNTALMAQDDRIREMVRNDVPVVEVSDVAATRELIRAFGIEALNTHQWHVQKYPSEVPDVFDSLRVHVASLHGMIEHGDAFGATEEQLRLADDKVTTWVYTADKNLVPFVNCGLYDETSTRFAKIPNGMMPATVVPVSRSSIGIPEDAFVLCCVSRAIPDKGWAETIEAVERARALSNRDIRLILVGNGPVYDEYCQSGGFDFVHFAGFSENSVGFYAAADMGIMLTKFKSESFPLTIVDCLFAGRPYIATDVGDIRNMLTEGKDVAGAVIELEDWEVPVDAVSQIIAAFASNEEKYRMANALVAGVANRYKIDMVTSKYVELFNTSHGRQRLGSEERRRDPQQLN